MAGTRVEVKGAAELQRAINSIDRGAGREINKVLKNDIGKPVAAEVAAMVDSRGLHLSGDLHNSIKPSAKRGEVVIRSSPALRPGPNSPRGYAPIYEFGNGGARAFMRPVFEEWSDSGKAEHEMEKVLNWAANRWSAG